MAIGNQSRALSLLPSPPLSSLFSCAATTAKPLSFLYYAFRLTKAPLFFPTAVALTTMTAAAGLCLFPSFFLSLSYKRREKREKHTPANYPVLSELLLCSSTIAYTYRHTLFLPLVLCNALLSIRSHVRLSWKTLLLLSPLPHCRVPTVFSLDSFFLG